MKCRKMTLDDLDQVLHVERASFKTPWSRGSFLNEIINNKMAYYIVATIEDNIIGYAGFWCILDEGHITNIAIAPDFRGRGFSKEMVMYLIETALSIGINQMTLEVRVSNDVAIHLYKKFGFKPCGIRPKYYYDTGEDALIMWADITHNRSNDENISD